MTISKNYLRQKRACRRLAEWTDGHPRLLNVLTAAEIAVFVLYVFLNY